MLAIPARVIATCFALVAFAASVIVGGFGAGNDFTTVIGRATIAMLVCWVAGYAVGWSLTYIMRLQIEAYKQAHPLPDLHGDEAGEDEAAVAPSANGSSQTGTVEA